MTETTTGPDARPPRTWTRILLVLSLGLNLIIIGSLGGLALSRAIRGPFEPVHDLAFGPFTQALSPDDRHAMLHAFATEAKGFRAERDQMRADFQALVAALKADPYDPSVLDGVMARQKARTDQWLALGQRLLAERLTAMTPAERAAFADRLSDDLSRRSHHGTTPPPASD
ncbi:MAG: periplasmic heavy metal sensor [Rhodobacteraceae bacterium]|nr:periplasmic heavy metal sensor [Paracoccaceae bacterium]